MAAEALDTVQGIEFAVYGFSTDVATFKPFDRTFDQRRGKIGAMSQHRLLGGSTHVARGLARAGRDLQRHFGRDDEVRKLVIMVTDGVPSDGEENI